ncbi:hypothetical protein BT96DRAFT_1020950 [Gymnopus androsaceus JB14]|uniref:F-box domain-containing protein n=1 Tax=Gymnopus androsaceus JB14 TaxID=1447944 RepID=A0A6A4HFN4_9AGAR|nr:hypothetical protein BT96DRAFT_1020950 [Gymnopus androsaceus JB14]
MAQYLSQPRIEGPVWLDQTEISLLQTRVLGRDSGGVSREPNLRIVLFHIFELFCLPEDSVYHAYHDIVCCTRMLSRVCVAWRKAALATPRIWSRLFLAPKHSKAFLGDVSWVKEWLSRSRGLPLELYLNFRYHSSEAAIRRGETQLLKHILDFRHRIRVLYLSGYPKTFLPIFHLPSSSLPSLEKVYLRIGDWEKHPMSELRRIFPDGVQVFLGAPKLRRFEVDETFTDDSALTAVVLPTDLASLTLHGSYGVFDSSIYAGILNRHETLVRLKI